MCGSILEYDLSDLAAYRSAMSRLLTVRASQKVKFSDCGPRESGIFLVVVMRKQGGEACILLTNTRLSVDWRELQNFNESGGLFDAGNMHKITIDF